MALGTLLAVVLALLGLITAVVFGVQGRRLLAEVRKTPQLATPRDATAADPADDVPTMRFKGEEFERRFQGSRGYERPDDLWAQASRNWTDYLVVPVITRLRPSRFSDRSYWTRYLPTIYGIRLLAFVLLPLLITLVDQPSSGAVGTFSPTRAQRSVPASGAAYLADPPACAGSGAAGGAQDEPVWVSYPDDGTVFSVRPGGLVGIRYLYGKPVFSPGVPLCAPTGRGVRDTSGVVEYQVEGSGSGYIYIPQPTGTIVTQIEVARDYAPIVFVILGLTAAVLCFDAVVLVRVRRATRARFTALE